MSAGFKSVQWNRDKFVYDGILFGAVIVYIVIFAIVSFRQYPNQAYLEAVDTFIRAFGSCAFIMLSAILAIGPLARLFPKLRPLLYNRRHFGVLTFFIALIHALLMIEWYRAQGALPSLLTELSKTEDYLKFIGFPFKILGLGALLIMLVMAATSHDFWLEFLGPRAWKAIHMAVYAAYGLAVMHVALGIMQYDRNPLIPLMLIASAGIVGALHLAAGWREEAGDRGIAEREGGWLTVGAPELIPDKRARIVSAPGGERIAVFRNGNIVSAVTNLCAHQNGPLGEGRVVNGCIVCPWHGYEYRVDDGCAPPPFTEKLVTYRLRLRDGILEVNTEPQPPGTPVAIAVDREPFDDADLRRHMGSA
ncbi:MAG: Rieske 2Fe-2S domain-containing protein [Rhodomicrobium sp.]|nr:Rieske 2Fe-2S domain-containing protein [Rhodomicrobium sp.]